MSKILQQRPVEEITEENKPQPSIKPENHLDIIVDSKKTPVINLVTHVEGYPWTVNYYRQILNKSSSVTGFNPNKKEQYQTYDVIYGYVFKVSTPLSQTQDEQKRSFTLEGSANVPPPLIPNVGDLFISDIGDGRLGIFQIKNSTRKTIFNDSTYVVDYVCTGYVDEEKEFFKQLEDKVIKKYYFDDDFLKNGQDPLIHDSDYGTIEKIRQTYNFLLKKYFTKYFSKKYSTMVLPLEDKVVYDHFLTKAIGNWYTRTDYYDLINLKIYNIDDNQIMKNISIFDVISDKRSYSFDEIFTRVKKLSTAYFERDPRMFGIRFSSVKYIVCPVDYLDSVDTDHFLKKHIIDSASTEDFIYEKDINHLNYEEKQLLPVINNNVSYIFSESFYKKEYSEISLLEGQILNYLENKNLDPKLLIFISDNYEKWSKMQQFYLTPFVLTLLKSYIRKLK